MQVLSGKNVAVIQCLLALFTVVGTASAEPVTSASSSGVGGHWAYQRPVEPAIPNVKNARWVKSPIDAFVLAKLEEKGLTPATGPTADAYPASLF